VQNKYFLVLSTAPVDVAQELGRRLVEKRLVACVNIIDNVASYYFWQDKLSCEEEHLLLMKTTAKILPELEKYIKIHHPYKIPEFLTIEIGGSTDYLDWLERQVG